MSIINLPVQFENRKIAGQIYPLLREDLLPGGSWKDRLVTAVWEELAARPEPEIVASTSGNLGLALMHWQLNAMRTQQPAALRQKLVLFLPANGLPPTKKEKLERLHSELREAGSAVELRYEQKAKSAALRYARNQGAYWFRPSMVPQWANTYRELGHATAEIMKANGLNTLVLGCSSGTAAEGIMVELSAQGLSDIRVILVQTSHVYPLAKEYQSGIVYELTSEANAISDRVMARKPMLAELLTKFSGTSVAVNNDELEAAQRAVAASSGELADFALLTGNSVLALAGYWKAQELAPRADAKPLLIVSGH